MIEDSDRWRSIASAPKDGRPVWTRGWDFGKPDTDRHYQWAYWDGSNWRAQGSRGSILNYLEQWMDLP